MPLQVPSSGISPATGLYVDEPSSMVESPRMIVETPSIGRSSEAPSLPPQMPTHYDSPADVGPDSQLEPIPTGAFGKR